MSSTRSGGPPRDDEIQRAGGRAAYVGGDPTAAGERVLTPQLLRLAAVVVLGAITTILDVTIVNVGLATLGGDFRTSIATLQWVSTVYLLAFAGVIPLTGWASEGFGAKPLWLASLAGFMLGSLLAGLSWSIGALIAFRALQGLAGGMIMPLGQSILAQAAGPRRMGRVMSLVGVPMLLAPIFGPVIGGAIVGAASWRWMFFINLPVGGLALLLAGAAGRHAAGGAGAGRPVRVARAADRPPVDRCAPVHPARVRHRRRHQPRARCGAVRCRPPAGPLLPDRPRCEPAADRAAAYPARTRRRLRDHPCRQPDGQARRPPRRPRRRPAGPGRHRRLHPDQRPHPLLVHGGGVVPDRRRAGRHHHPSMAVAYQQLTPGAVPRATSAINVVQRVAGSLGTALLAVVLQATISSQLPGPRDGIGQAAALATSQPAEATTRLAHGFAATFWVAFALTAAALLPALLLPGSTSNTPRPAHPGPGPRWPAGGATAPPGQAHEKETKPIQRRQKGRPTREAPLR